MTQRRPAKRAKGLSFDDVCKLGLALPGTARSTSYGTAALKVDGKLFARLKEDGETLVLKMDIVSRDMVLSAQPRIFYITDHYRDYPYVLVRLGEVTTKQMEELLEDSWRLAAPKKRLRE
ncbi:MAG TPA: MmcQ/YjbR family DNA-binding protein [Gemmatimonadaceae bacterium]